MQNHALYYYALCETGIISHFGREIMFSVTATFRLTVLVIKIKSRKRRVRQLPSLCHAASLEMPNTYTMKQIETHLLHCVL